MRIRIYILLVLIHFTPFRINGQNVICNSIDFNLVPISESDTATIVWKYKLNVGLDLHISNFDDDTLTLITKIKIGEELGPKNLSAWIIDKSNNDSISIESCVENHIDSQPFNDNQFLKFHIPQSGDINLSVSYDVLGSGLFFYIQQLNHPYLFTFHPDYELYYPVNMQINNIGKVNSPGEIQSFCSYDLNYESINLTYIDKNYFAEEYFDFKNLQMKIYIPDSIQNDNNIRNNINELIYMTDTLSCFLKTRKDISIILVNWRDEVNRRSFGRAFGNHCICDYTFPANSLLHELLHIVFPSKVEDGSKGEYYVKESIIEWLSLYLSDRLDKIDIQYKPQNHNLYDIHINDSNSWELIYAFGPTILQKLANITSEKKMADVIIDFLQEHEGLIIDYNHLLNHFKKEFGSDLIENMDSMVKGVTSNL